ncbi:MAG: hypothetical protein J3Q66DRAFT_59964 [Benniella sp.]|nr:MAG: hypothetical protein J3Q66DRAFT_59964 [Benniella sp.]
MESGEGWVRGGQVGRATQQNLLGRILKLFLSDPLAVLIAMLLHPAFFLDKDRKAIRHGHTIPPPPLSLTDAPRSGEAYPKAMVTYIVIPNHRRHLLPCHRVPLLLYSIHRLVLVKAEGDSRRSKIMLGGAGAERSFLTQILCKHDSFFPEGLSRAIGCFLVVVWEEPFLLSKQSDRAGINGQRTGHACSCLPGCSREDASGGAGSNNSGDRHKGSRTLNGATTGGKSHTRGRDRRDHAVLKGG